MQQTPGYVRACYDTVAGEYAEQFSGELAHKPLDRRLLRRFAEAARGPVCDLGCGPGHTTAFLRACGADARGVDLSPALLRQARARQPGVPLAAGDMLALPLRSGSLAGVVAFYAIVHFDPEQLRTALREMRRVLAPGGRLLLAFHVGEAVIPVPEFLGRPVSLAFVFFPVEQVREAVEGAGFAGVDAVVREPYPGVEHPSRRAYVWARAPGPDEK